MTKNQKKVLNLLLDQYENSKTYTGENKVNQRFWVSPEDIIEKYYSHYIDMKEIKEIKKFEEELNEMQDGGFINLEYKDNEIQKIVANKDKFGEYYKVLSRREKSSIIQEQIDLLNKHIEERNDIAYKNPVIDGFCDEQMKRLKSGKKPVYSNEEINDILNLLIYIFTNKENILEREMSISVLNDSKKWENKYRARICNLIKKYDPDYKEDKFLDKRESEKVLLEEYNIYSNPTYIYFKGDADILFYNGYKMSVSRLFPLALSSDTLNNISQINVKASKIITIENLTSFNRMECNDSFLIYTSGYSSTPVNRLIKKMNEKNKGKEYYHFGDIDPDGFYILKNLREKTGVDFKPLHMGTMDLMAYREYAKPLEENDKRKGEILKDDEEYGKVIQCMLKNNIKLEQEIISWKNQKEL